MIKLTILKYFVLIFIYGINTIAFAQNSVSGSADLVSKYLWRGLELTNSFSVQPVPIQNLLCNVL